MSDLTIKTSDVTFDGNSKFTGVIAGLTAGSAITAFAPCYIKSDGKIYMADASGSTCDGFSVKAYSTGQPVTIVGKGAIFTDLADSLTPGAKFYLSTTTGAFATAATNDQAAIAKAIDADSVIVL